MNYELVQPDYQLIDEIPIDSQVVKIESVQVPTVVQATTPVYYQVVAPVRYQVPRVLNLGRWNFSPATCTTGTCR
jgi:hypothetical protein